MKQYLFCILACLALGMEREVFLLAVNFLILNLASGVIQTVKIGSPAFAGGSTTTFGDKLAVQVDIPNDATSYTFKS